jgi:hypothetical protein
MNDNYVYLLIEREFLKTNESIYKIGRTNQIPPLNRIQQYPKNSRLIFLINVDNSTTVEKIIKKELIMSPEIKQRTDIGHEYFEGDINLIKEIFLMSYQKTQITRAKIPMSLNWGGHPHSPPLSLKNNPKIKITMKRQAEGKKPKKHINSDNQKLETQTNDNNPTDQKLETQTNDNNPTDQKLETQTNDNNPTDQKLETQTNDNNPTDQLQNYIDTYLERDQNAYLTLKTIFYSYQQSDFFQKNTLQKTFKEDLERKLGKCQDKPKLPNGKRLGKRSVFMGYKLNTP